MLLRLCYAVSGTDRGYAGTRLSSIASHTMERYTTSVRSPYAVPGTALLYAVVSAYARPTRYPVLVHSMMLSY
eukprot:2960740-Rhodomonas_salina.1